MDLPHFSHQPSQFTTIQANIKEKIFDNYFDEDQLEGKKGDRRALNSEESDNLRANFASKQTERDLLPEKREERKRAQDDFSYDDEDEQEMFSFKKDQDGRGGRLDSDDMQTTSKKPARRDAGPQVGKIGMNKNQQRHLFSDDGDVNNTGEGEGEISGSNGSGMEEPDYDQVRKADAKGQSIGVKDVKRSVGQVNNFAFNHGVGDASKNGSKKLSID